MLLSVLLSPLILPRVLLRTPLPRVLQALLLLIAQILTLLAVVAAVVNFFGSRAVISGTANTLAWLATDIDATVTSTTENTNAIRWGVWVAATLSNIGYALDYVAGRLEEDAMITPELASMALRWTFGKLEHLAAWLAGWFFRVVAEGCDHFLVLILRLLPVGGHIGVPVALAGLAVVAWTSASLLEFLQTGRVAWLDHWLPERSPADAASTVLIVERENTEPVLVTRHRANSIS